jgi:uncharacterized membrane protein HdeD (DUF308 family)
MLSSFAHHGWFAVLRGTLAIAFGLAAFVWPGLTLATLVALFGACALVDGIVTLGLGLFGLGSNKPRGATVLSGALGVLAGIVTFAQPAAAAFGLLYVIAAWAMITGLLQVAAAAQLREVISDEWLMGLGGALSVVFGILLLAAPASGVLTLVFLFGYYTISGGIAHIGFGLRLRGLGQNLPRPSSRPSSRPATLVSPTLSVSERRSP